MRLITEGPGDVITWGAIVSNQDPRYVGFTGELTTKMFIGEGGCPVTVTQTYFDDEPDETVVMFEGIDIAGCLPQASFDEIEAHFQRNWSRILRENEELV